MKPKQKQRLAGIGAGIAVILAAAYWTFGTGPSQKQVLETAAVELGDLSVELPATGNIDAVNVIDVGAVVSGRITALHADFNDHVKAGQLLAEIEDDDYRATYHQAEADLKAAQAAVEVTTAEVASARDEQARATAAAQRAKAFFEKARLDLEREQKTLTEEISTKASFDKIQTAYLTARAEAASSDALIVQAASKIKSAQAAVEQARAVVEQRAARAAMAKRNVDYCRIASPVDGVVVSRNADVGQTLAARLQAPSLYHIAQDLSHMYVYTKLDSADVSKVHPGLRATFTVNAFPGETFEGKLVQVRINPNPEAPVSRANATGQIQRTISAGVVSGPFAGGEQSGGSSAGGSSGSSGQSGGSGGSRQSSVQNILSSTSTGTSSGSAPPTGTRNTVVAYDALIEFSNPDQKLIPGMTAYVTIPVNSVKGALKVPTAALRFSPSLPEQQKQRLLEENHIGQGDAFIWLVTGDKVKQYRPVAVKPILTDYVMTAVESEGLKPGMQVATRYTEAKPAA